MDFLADFGFRFLAIKNRITINRKSALLLLAKNVLIPLGLTAAASAAKSGMHKTL